MGNTSRQLRKARIRFHQSDKERDYLQWKDRALSPYCNPICRVKVFGKRTGKYYNKVRFDTQTLSIFNRFRKSFYVENRETIPSKISSYLTSPLALAVWYLDDGGKKTNCKAYRLHTNCYSLLEVEPLKQTLGNNFHISPTFHKQGRGVLI